MSNESKRRWYHRNKERINAARRVGPANFGDRVCPICKEPFGPKVWNQVICGDSECVRENRRRVRDARMKADPDARRAKDRERYAKMTPAQRAARNAADRARYRANPEPRRTRNRERARKTRKASS